MYPATRLFKRLLVMSLLLQPMLVLAKRDTIMTRQGVEVYIKNNRSRKLKLIVEGHLVDLETTQTDYGRVGGGINADYLFWRLGSISAGYRGTYYSITTHEAGLVSYSRNVLKNFSEAYAGGRFHIWDGKGWIKRKMTLDRFDEYDVSGQLHSKARYLKARFPCRRIIALRGGVYSTNTPVSANMTLDVTKLPSNMEKGTVTTANGTVLRGEYYTNTRTTGIYAGLTRLFHMKFDASNDINWEESQTKLTAIFRETYLDIILANTTIEPFNVKGKYYEVRPNNPGSFLVDRIGWRFGGRLISTAHLINTGISYELGSRPGIGNFRGAYLRIGLDIALMK